MEDFGSGTGSWTVAAPAADRADACPGRVGDAELAVWPEQCTGDLVRISAVFPIDQRHAARSHSSFRISSFQNGNQECRLVVRGDHEHRQALSNRRRTVSKEPDQIRTGRHDDPCKAPSAAELTTRLIRAAKSSLLNAAGTEGLLVVITNSLRF